MPQWLLANGAYPSASLPQHEFDAVVICNGHFSEPRLPSVKGSDVFPGLQMHAHNYRNPDRFKGQVGEPRGTLPYGPSP